MSILIVKLENQTSSIVQESKQKVNGGSQSFTKQI